MERRLGRGLGSLLGGTGDSGVEMEPGTQDSPTPTTQSGPSRSTPVLPLSSVHPNPDQPRKVFAEEFLEELQASISNHGVLQPIVVRPSGPDSYEIISGERRWRAARAAGLSEIPVNIRDTRDEEMLELALVENVQRKDLDAMEKARGFQEMMNQLGLTQDQVASKVGLKRATVANHLRLLELPDAVQDGVAQGMITMGHARALLSLGSPKEILRGFQRVVRVELSVRATEAMSRQASPGAAESKRGGGSDGLASDDRKEPWVGELEKRILAAHGLLADISDSGDGAFKGRVVLRYHDREELDRIVGILAPPDEL